MLVLLLYVFTDQTPAAKMSSSPDVIALDDATTTLLPTLPSSRFTPEWWWVFTYGISVVLIIVFNALTLISICKNSFLHTNTNRAFSLLALRNTLRAMYGLVVLYTTRWRHMEGWKIDDNHQTKVDTRV